MLRENSSSSHDRQRARTILQSRKQMQLAVRQVADRHYACFGDTNSGTLVTRSAVKVRLYRGLSVRIVLSSSIN